MSHMYAVLDRYKFRHRYFDSLASCSHMWNDCVPRFLVYVWVHLQSALCLAMFELLAPQDVTASFHKYLAVILGERTEAAEDAMFTRKIREKRLEVARAEEARLAQRRQAVSQVLAIHYLNLFVIAHQNSKLPNPA